MLDRLKLEEGWSTLLLVWALIMTAAAAIITAELTDGLDVLLIIGSAGVLAGLLLSKSTFAGSTAHIFALVYGFALIAFLIGRTLPEDLTWRERVLDMIFRQFQWLNKAIEGGTSRDGLIFILQTSGIFWLLGYTASWYTFRKPRVWRVVIPTGLVLLSVVYYYYGTKPLPIYLAIYALLALLYIARTYVVAQEKSWRAASVRYERMEVRFSFLRAGFLIAVLAVLIAWSAPALGASAVVGDALYDANQPWRRFQDHWTRLFASLGSYGSGVSDPYQDTLVLGGPRSVSSDPIMDVYVSDNLPYVYWHAVALDTYDGQGGWSVADRDTAVVDSGEGLVATPPMIAREVVTQTVVTYINNSSTIYGAPYLVGSDRSLLVDYKPDEQGVFDVQGLRSRFALRAGDTYNVISAVSRADIASLRAASTEYPEWIAEYYLQMPETITPDTVRLAQEITAPYNNAYDKAWAVQTWMRDNIAYNDQIDAPPDTTEPVHYTLFVSREAYCTYYASAMTLMLRSQGIPSRIVNGYAQGEFREDSNSYRVKANDAHTWVEVYFPEYGWIQFEPTATIPVVDRPQTEVPIPGEGGESELGALGLDESLQEVEEPDPADLAREAELPNPEIVNAGSLASMLPWLLRAFVGLVVLGFAGLLLLLANRYNQRVEQDVEMSYGRLESWARWLGIGFRPIHTPYERADMLTAVVPEGSVPIRNLTQHYVLRMFSPHRGGRNNFDPHQEWRALRPLLLRRSVKRRLSVRRRSGKAAK